MTAEMRRRLSWSQMPRSWLAVATPSFQRALSQAVPQTPPHLMRQSQARQDRPLGYGLRQQCPWQTLLSHRLQQGLRVPQALPHY
jgi:hypothetical protein